MDFLSFEIVIVVNPRNLPTDVGVGSNRNDVAGQRAPAERDSDAHAGCPWTRIAGRDGVREDAIETAGGVYLKVQRGVGGKGTSVAARSPLLRRTARSLAETPPSPGRPLPSRL